MDNREQIDVMKLVGLLIDEGRLRLSFFNEGKQSAMSKRSLLSTQIQEQVKEVKVVIFWEKARNAFAGVAGNSEGCEFLQWELR